jgi:hypothetical protein
VLAICRARGCRPLLDRLTALALGDVELSQEAVTALAQGVHGLFASQLTCAAAAAAAVLLLLLLLLLLGVYLLSS